MQTISELEGTTHGPNVPVAWAIATFEQEATEKTEANPVADAKSPLTPFPPIESGGGWVNDSEPEAEFQETVNKSKAMLKAVALAETFGKGK